MLGRAATAASLFFLFGLSGHAIGPALGGFIIERVGIRGVLMLTVLALPVAFNSISRLFWSPDHQRLDSNATSVTNKENVFEGSIISLKRFKDDVQEVLQNYECGMVLDYEGIEIGDIIEVYNNIEEKPKL